ncbi:MAG: ABC transporter permease [Deltaproteobacteria bacterium RBG_13_53_10]|nr:MAG: ABC transporter permease [Deltaproteobacteria bacterium RBG_13_53_10]
MESLSINVLNGIAFGMILFLIASGLSVIYGFMGVLNLAHGVFYILGAYFGLIVRRHEGSFVLAALAGGLAVGLLGLVLERVFLSLLHKRINEQVLLTLGFVYIFSNIVRWVWGPYAKLIDPPAFASGTIPIGSASYPLYRLVIILMGLAVAAGLWLLNNKTRAGSILRAGMDDREMTVGLGVNYGLVATVVFVLGAFVGGFAGFIGLPIVAVHPGIVFDILLLSLIVIIVGGVGRIEGVLLGSMIIGLIDSLGRAYFPEFAYFTMYIAMIIILLVKPTGLLGRAL